MGTQNTGHQLHLEKSQETSQCRSWSGAKRLRTSAFVGQCEERREMPYVSGMPETGRKKLEDRAEQVMELCVPPSSVENLHSLVTGISSNLLVGLQVIPALTIRRGL